MNSSGDDNKLTYDMILREFKNKNPEIEIVDYRPCCELFGFPKIDNAIVMWTKNGTKIVYKSEVEDGNDRD